MKEKDVVFDIETFPNCYTFAACDVDGKNGVVFEISGRRNHSQKLIQYLRDMKKKRKRLVGFNNIGFDYPVLHYILEKAIEAKKNGLDFSIDAFSIYRKAMSVINAGDEEKWAITIPENKMHVKQIDLYKIHHFDIHARATSLKMLEFNMKSDNIEDLPFPPGTYLTSEQMDILIKYNCHDVRETLRFYNHSVGMIEFRESLTVKYGINFLNANDTKIGKDYFIHQLELQNPGCCYNTSGKGKKIRQTIRNSIAINDVIFPYVKFDRPEFNAVLDWFRKQVITETKGVFTDILEKDLGELAKYAQLTVKKKKLAGKPTDAEIAAMKQDNPLCWIEEVELKAKNPKKDGGGFKKAYWLCWNVADCLNVVVDGLRYDFGTGGLHGCFPAGIYESDDEYVYEDRDVKSYYPNLAIRNRIYPEHLSDKFCDIYEEIYDQRQLYPKGSAENAMFKLALNGSYGASNDQYSPLYDPKFTMAITIGGQLSLCMLAEKLIEKGAEIMMLNTDGLTFKVKRDNIVNTDEVCDNWCNITKLELENVFYSKMCVKDVNNYLMVYEE